MENISRPVLEQTLIERHTAPVHEKISKARVAIAGLGGLGSNIAVSLARMGIGALRLFDFDRVEISNLNRQQYGLRHIGMYKTDALRDIIAEINPYINVETNCVKIDSTNAAELFREEQIVCEAFDLAENKAMLINTLLTKCPCCMIVAASGMAGYGPANEIVTRKAGQRLYICGDGKTDLTDYGLMAPRVTICANHQANVVLRLILGEE